jgi:stage III sporulation protein AG
MGAIVLCQGADVPSVRLAIVDAVSKVTGLVANQISVLKMK